MVEFEIKEIIEQEPHKIVKVKFQQEGNLKYSTASLGIKTKDFNENEIKKRLKRISDNFGKEIEKTAPEISSHPLNGKKYEV